MEALQEWFTYVQDNSDFILEESLAHARIVLVVIALGTIFSVVLGVLVYRYTVLRSLVLGLSGVFLTIPSLALFALFVPLVGIGNLPAMMALFLYAILPILRNTVTGMDSVSPAVVESAKGMGMSWSQQLVRVRLPLAWPVIMAGIRVSSLMVVGIAAIAVLVGGDGLGEFIRTGVNSLGFPFASYSVWTGVVFTVLLGLLLDTAFALLQRFTTPRGLRI